MMGLLGTRGALVTTMTSDIAGGGRSALQPRIEFVRSGPYIFGMSQFHRLSLAQQIVLGELRTGPQWEGGVRTRTFRSLARRGLVVAIESGDLAYRWKLTSEGARLVLALGIAAPRWLTRVADRRMKRNADPELTRNDPTWR